MWKDIPGYEGLYQVSDMGEVKSLYGTYGKEIIMKSYRRKDGYVMVWLTSNRVRRGYYVHRLVAAAFLGLDLNSFKYGDTICICHKDDNTSNNVLENLFLGTQLDNIKDRDRKGRHGMLGKFGGLNHSSKKVYQFTNEGVFIQSFGSLREVQRNTGISCSSVGYCCNGKRKTSGGFIWKYTLCN